MPRRAKIEHTGDWRQVGLLRGWPERVAYERVRSPVVFGDSVAERFRQSGTPESTLRREVAGFGHEGMLSLFEPEQAEGHSFLDAETHRLILNLNCPS